MERKLTLGLDERAIDGAKAYTKRTGASLSQLVANYFNRLSIEPDEDSEEITPIVQELKGSWKNAKVAEDDYRNYLEDEYK